MEDTKEEGFIGDIEDLDFFGQGILHREGKCFFVKNALPGETVRVKVVSAKKKYGRGETLEILAPSPSRTDPPCPYYGHCGGCQFQHVAYEEELAAKLRHLKQTLTRIGGLKELPEIEVLPAPALYQYRQKVTWQVVGGQIGYFKENSRAFVPVERCLLLASPLEELTAVLRRTVIPGLDQAMLRCNEKGELFLLLHGNIKDRSELAAEIMGQTPALLGIAFVNQAGKTYVKGASRLLQKLGDFSFRIDPQSFFQVNTKAAQALMAEVKAKIAPGKNLLDLYCGTGAWGIFLADRFQAVYGMDVVGQAVEDARFNAEQNRVKGEYHQGKTEEQVSHWLKDMPPMDTVLVDPPRQGLFPGVPEILASYGAKQLLYASCDPGTLARDLKILCAETYRPAAIIAADFFPRTAHVETVVLMSRVKE